MSNWKRWTKGTRFGAWMTGGLMIAALMLQSGCGGVAPEPQPAPAPGLEPEPEPEPEPEDINRSPLADAGEDLDVEGGALVQLDGGASVDDDGDRLQFSWAQTAGTPVVLTGATTATPTFTAPNEDVDLEFELTVTDGRGGTDIAAVRVAVTARLARLFITNRGGSSILSYEDPGSLNGNIRPDTNLQGAQTQLDAASDVVVTAGGALIVSNAGGASLARFDDATATNGNIEPDALVQGAATNLFIPLSLALNAGEDLVFAANAPFAAITVYERASESSFNGNLPPVRTINTLTTGDLSNPSGINFGAGDELYVANRGRGNILVFANASNLNGDVAPSRIITSNDFGDLVDVFVGRDDTMFVVDQNGGEVLVFENAATLNGQQTPDVILDVDGAAVLGAIVVDAAGIGYITDLVRNAIFIYDDIAAANGEFLPDRTITGLQTQIRQPERMFLVE
jgi:hypothetical protein